MPSRVIREALLDSEAWLALKSNDDRVCWLVLVLNADTFGNQTAGPHRLVHLWRHAGIDTTEKAAKVLSELNDVGLTRSYQIDGRPFVHIPKFDSPTRYLGKLNPPPPWATEYEKQCFAKKSRVNHKSTPEIHRDAPEGVGVGVGVNTKPGREVGKVIHRDEGQKPGEISPKVKSNGGPPWWETESGTMAKAAELNLNARPGETMAAFRARIVDVAGKR